MNPVRIKTTALCKTFGNETAVGDLNLEIAAGELFGLVGPDGAGKTTTMRLLTGMMRPSSGEGWVAGHSILHESEKIKEKIGYMSQRFGLYEDLSVLENIHFYADLYEVPKKERPARLEKLLNFSNLLPFKDRLGGQLSGGMKQKLGLACALIHTPEILFLDEPTNGVDPVSRRDFWRILYELLKEGITIFVSTAYLDEAERCARVALIHKGKILTNTTPEEMKKSFGLNMFQVWVENGRLAREIIARIPGIKSASVYGDSIHMAIEEKKMVDSVLNELSGRGIKIKSHREILPSLEDIFISKVGKT